MLLNIKPLVETCLLITLEGQSTQPVALSLKTTRKTTVQRVSSSSQLFVTALAKRNETKRQNFGRYSLFLIRDKGYKYRCTALFQTKPAVFKTTVQRVHFRCLRHFGDESVFPHRSKIRFSIPERCRWETICNSLWTESVTFPDFGFLTTERFCGNGSFFFPFLRDI